MLNKSLMVNDVGELRQKGIPLGSRSSWENMGQIVWGNALRRSMKSSGWALEFYKT